ncbi:MAG: hypothetical protein C4582_05670 [Desulfobacteraceae bacterium]|nr:MAG: hypothetical protein C4582_05670 [Desulfobacteraceae bacterium]
MKAQIGHFFKNVFSFFEQRVVQVCEWLPIYVGIFSGELRQMVGQCFESGGNETGGEGYGLNTHAGRAVILFVTPAGPKAIHKPLFFQQDIAFANLNNAYLTGKMGIQINSTFHLHTAGCSGSPSGLDRDSSHEVVSRKAIAQFYQFIVTFENGSSLSPDQNLSPRLGYESPTSKPSGNRFYNGLGGQHRRGPRQGKTARSETDVIAYVNAYMYSNREPRRPIPCPIRVIPGISPIREAIARSCPIPELRQRIDFPLQRIRFKAYEPESENRSPTISLPHRTYTHCLKLPEHIRDNITVATRDGLLVVSVPIPPKGMMFVVYDLRTVNRVKAVYVSEDHPCGAHVDITEKVLRHGVYTNLSTIYEKGSEYLGRTKSYGHKWIA